MEEMSNSILGTIKKLIGYDESYHVFDLDLIVAINSSFMILNQLGVGPKEPFSIKDENATWADFFGDKEIFELAKSYVYLRVKLLFDAPNSGVLHQAVERQISEFEWRMQVQAEYNNSNDDSEDANKPISHDTLINRDLPNQHPIDAIAELRDILKTIPTIMSSEELRKIMQS